MLFLGLDTSNYTTSAAVYDSEDNNIIQKKMLLPVKNGELGLRQSDAVFHHTKQLPIIISELFSDKHLRNISAIGVSVRPRNIEGSYMPCFLSGEGTAEVISSVKGVCVYKTSHQVGHILSALYSSDKLDLINKKFIAFHVSGGTTDCLLCEPDEKEIINVTQISSSLDLKAGQAIDRVGVMLGLKFPCGPELEKLALKSTESFKIKPSMKELDCSLSGIENKCKKMLSENKSSEDISKFCLMSVYAVINKMTELALLKFGQIPVVFAGGVMSNSIIKEKLSGNFDAYFAKPEFSCDNAAGTAIFASLKHK